MRWPRKADAWNLQTRSRSRGAARNRTEGSPARLPPQQALHRNVLDGTMTSSTSERPTPAGSKSEALNKRFTAKLQKSPAKGGHTYVIWPGSAEFFGPRGLVKVR